MWYFTVLHVRRHRVTERKIVGPSRLWWKELTDVNVKDDVTKKRLLKSKRYLYLLDIIY